MTNQTAPTLEEFLDHYRSLPATHRTAILALTQSASKIPLADLDRLIANIVAAPFDARPGLIAEYLTTAPI